MNEEPLKRERDGNGLLCLLALQSKGRGTGLSSKTARLVLAFYMITLIMNGNNSKTSRDVHVS